MTHVQRFLRRKRMAAEVDVGRLPAAVATGYRVSEVTVVQACRQFGVRVNGTCSRGVGLNKTTLRIIARLEHGDSLQEIAEAFNKHPTRIEKIYENAREAGLMVQEPG